MSVKTACLEKSVTLLLDEPPSLVFPLFSFLANFLPTLSQPLETLTFIWLPKKWQGSLLKNLCILHLNSLPAMNFFTRCHQSQKKKKDRKKREEAIKDEWIHPLNPKTTKITTTIFLEETSPNEDRATTIESCTSVSQKKTYWHELYSLTQF